MRLGKQLFDDFDHLRDVVGRPRLHVGIEAAERFGVRQKLRFGLLCHPPDRFIERQGRIVAQRPRIDLVVDVGDVAGIGHVLRAIDVAQQPEKHIEDNHRPGIADMGIIIDRRAADIHADVVGIDRPELDLLPRQRVVQL
ncbi:hypothetical protein D9M72_296970 [compost metagenome]